MLGSIRVCAAGTRVFFGIPLVNAHALVDAEVEASTPDGETKQQLSLTAIIEHALALDLKMWEGASGWFAKLEAGQALVMPPGHLVGEFGVASGKSSVVVKEAFLTENHCRDNRAMVEQMTLLANLCSDDAFKVWKLMTLNQAIPLVQAISAAHHTSAMAAKLLSSTLVQGTPPSSKSTLAQDALTDSRKMATPLKTSPGVVKTEEPGTPCSTQNGVASARASPASAAYAKDTVSQRLTASAKDAHVRIAFAPTPKAKLRCGDGAIPAAGTETSAIPAAGTETSAIPAAPGAVDGAIPAAGTETSAKSKALKSLARMLEEAIVATAPAAAAARSPCSCRSLG